MAVDDLLRSWFAATLAAITFLSLLLLSTSVVSFLLDKRGLRPYPGPLLARLSDAWITWVTARGKVNIAVADAHKTYGPFVRIAPNHISIADPSALQSIYGHGSGILKSDFYDVFPAFGGKRSTFTTRNRDDHSRKRKFLSNTFSQKSTLEFEPVVRQYIGGVIKQWDRMCAAAAKGKAGIMGDMPWSSNEGRAVFDTLKWFNFMVFDIIGDLVFRAPFGMTERATDLALVAKRAEDAISAYGASDVKLEYDALNVIKATNERTAFVVAIGQLPTRVRELVRKLPLPWVRRGNDGFWKLAAMAATAVAHRTQHSARTRSDILTKYFDATDEQGNTMDNLEISAEALGLLIAGTDTTSNSVAAITFYIAQNLAAQAKLHRELDGVLGVPNAADDGEEPTLVPYEKIKNLPYLQDVVNEGLRLFSTVGLGLPRVVSAEGVTILGHTFAPGTVISVPTYILHHDKTIWGEDAESFNPDRWANGDRKAMMKAFAPFSVGPRACIGRNLASMELLMVVANIFYRFEATSACPGQRLDIHDGFVRKPSSSVVALKRRGHR